jgi:hypothetical protein
VVGVQTVITPHASLLGATLDVVRRVTVGALLVTGGLTAAQHQDVGVTITARGRLILREFVRTMTTNARPMT